MEIGEYGRTNKGKIFIFVWVENADGKRYTNKVLLGNGKIFENKFYYFDDGEEIVKHSKNIIDLVEVGDYVNGHLVVEISKNAYNQKLVITEVDGKDGAIRHHYLERSIKTVVTHEQFANVEYKV